MTTRQAERATNPIDARRSRSDRGAPGRGFRARRSELLARVRPDWLSDRVLLLIRIAAIVVWVLLFARECIVDGVPIDREGLLLWVATGAAAASIGRRSIASVLVDFLPLVLVLVAYDYLRGISDTLGMPTWWQPQIDVDRFLFAGHEPTVWLQEHLKHPDVRWYDVVVALCYYSFFLLPYVTAGVLWLRGRRDFYRWSLRFVALSFVGFAFFALTPAAPPWAAARCTAAQVANHPSMPSCMYYGDPAPGGLLGPFMSVRHGANPWIERIPARGIVDLHLGVAQQLWTKGFAVADPVAAVPSLHMGGTMLFVLFMWPRLRRAWRPLLVLYPLAMAFSLVYSGEHYFADCIAGVLAALLVHGIGTRIERWRGARRSADTLEGGRASGQTDPPSDQKQESPCPPSRPLPTP